MAEGMARGFNGGTLFVWNESGQHEKSNIPSSLLNVG